MKNLKTIDIVKCKLVKDSSLKFNSINNSDDVRNILQSLRMDESAEEHLLLLCLNTKREINGIHEISHGDINSSIVHPREIFKRAILNNAHSIILAHNHPSGNSTPSPEDISVTKKIKKAGELLGIPILDHLIIGNTLLSFHEKQII